MRSISSLNEYVEVRNTSAVNILWTGGWDSTFRLLNLISTYKCIVQPFYVIDRGRKSWQTEIATMKIILGEINDRAQYTGKVLDPLIVDKEEIDENPGITMMYDALLKRRYLGIQYEWLARLAEHFRIMDLELSVHRDDRAHTFLYDNVGVKMSSFGPTYVLQSESDHELSIFKYFTFPLFNLTKLDMEAIAKEQGFDDILEMSWFCSQPLKGRWVCGTCNPCQYTFSEGLARRVGWRGRLRHLVIVRWRRLLPAQVKRNLRLYLRKAS